MKTKEILAKIPIEIDDFSKLHVFFLALNQVILNNGKSLVVSVGSGQILEEGFV